MKSRLRNYLLSKSTCCGLFIIIICISQVDCAKYSKLKASRASRQMAPNYKGFVQKPTIISKNVENELISLVTSEKNLKSKVLDLECKLKHFEQKSKADAETIKILASEKHSFQAEAHRLSEKNQQFQSEISRLTTDWQKQKQFLDDRIELLTKDNFTCAIEMIILKGVLFTINSSLTNAITECKTLTNGLELTVLPSGLYYFYYDENAEKTWYEANDFCGSHGMRLLKLDDVTETAAVGHTMLQLGLPVDVDFWFGATELSATGKFVYAGWGDETQEIPWAPNEPNNNRGEHCGALHNEEGEGGLRAYLHQCAVGQPGFVCEVSQPCASLLKQPGASLINYA